MPGLHELLEDAVTDPVVVDPAADLRRGRRALTRRRTRWAAGVTGGLAVLGVVGASVRPPHSQERVLRPATQSQSAGPDSPYYDTPPPPAGWHLVGGTAYQVLFRRDGDPDADLTGPFDDAILVYLQAGRVHVGPAIPFDGRTFYEWGDGGDGLESMSVDLPDGNCLRIQYPKSAGLGSTEMRAFLDGVVVKDGAKATHG